MLVRCHHDPREFFDLVGPFLQRDEVENALPLGIARSFVDTATHDGLMFSVESGPEVVAVAVKSPRRNMVITRAPKPAMIALASYLFAYALPVPGVNGPCETAREFTAAWKALSGAQSIERTALRLFQAKKINDLPAPAGSFRYAALSDHEMVERWLHAFIEEATHDPHDKLRERVIQMIGAGNVGLWNDGDGGSMAAVTRRSQRGAHVAWVYTPRSVRGKGYATACVAELCRRELAKGREYCTLYTDLANATSNAIYQRIGFEPVFDAVDVVFEAT